MRGINLKMVANRQRHIQKIYDELDRWPRDAQFVLACGIVGTVIAMHASNTEDVRALIEEAQDFIEKASKEAFKQKGVKP